MNYAGIKYCAEYEKLVNALNIRFYGTLPKQPPIRCTIKGWRVCNKIVSNLMYKLIVSKVLTYATELVIILVSKETNVKNDIKRSG